MADTLEKLIRGIAAARFQLDAAMEKRSVRDCLVLQSSIIDGSLRVGLILKAQIDSVTTDVDETFLNRDEASPKFSELGICQQCRDAKVIDEALFSSLVQAYNKRDQLFNSVVGTDSNSDDAARLVFDFDDIVNSVKSAIGKLEDEQVTKSVGMTRLGPNPTEEDLKQFAGVMGRPRKLDS